LYSSMFLKSLKILVGGTQFYMHVELQIKYTLTQCIRSFSGIGKTKCTCMLFYGYLHDKGVTLHIPSHKMIRSCHIVYHLYVQVKFSKRLVGKAHPVHISIHVEYTSVHQSLCHSDVCARWSENVEFKHLLQIKSRDCGFVHSQKHNTIVNR
jgi:hypothetical protein